MTVEITIQSPRNTTVMERSFPSHLIRVSRHVITIFAGNRMHERTVLSWNGQHQDSALNLILWELSPRP